MTNAYVQWRLGIDKPEIMLWYIDTLTRHEVDFILYDDWTAFAVAPRDMFRTESLIQRGRWPGMEELVTPSGSIYGVATVAKYTLGTKVAIFQVGAVGRITVAMGRRRGELDILLSPETGLYDPVNEIILENICINDLGLPYYGKDVYSKMYT